MSVRYTKDHEWVRLEDGVAVVGITEYAAEQLGDVVYVELPSIGKTVAQGGEMAVVESAKAASDVYAPIAGAVAQVNEALNDNPHLVNDSAEGEGWFVKLTPANAGEVEALMDAAAYKAYVEGLE
jgi:glycine cleavage system H protein